MFPSDEASLLEARTGVFAGCISASANVNSRYCAKAWTTGDAASLTTAGRIRRLVSERNLIVSIKAVVAAMNADRAFEAVLPPLVELSETDRVQLLNDFRAATETLH